jgi:hypothetical protein
MPDARSSGSSSYRGAHRVHSFSCYGQLPCLAAAQSRSRESLRDIETCFPALRPKLYDARLRGRRRRGAPSPTPGSSAAAPIRASFPIREKTRMDAITPEAQRRRAVQRLLQGEAFTIRLAVGGISRAGCISGGCGTHGRRPSGFTTTRGARPRSRSESRPRSGKSSNSSGWNCTTGPGTGRPKLFAGAWRNWRFTRCRRCGRSAASWSGTS